MKKFLIISLVLITLFLTGFCFFCSAQTKEKVHIPKDSTVTIDTTYSIQLNKAEFQNLINVIHMIDEKPSILNKWVEENIIKKTQLVLPKKK